jgi:DNA-binding NarL/FixJ family response regulator
MTSRTAVLLCDDSRALRLLTARQLGECGFDVAGEADNGVAAVEQYQKLRPDVVLLDLVMPQQDGKQALRRILELDPQARVVILGSLGAQHDIDECLRLGAKSYLQKPIDPEAMVRVLREAVA